MKSKTGSYLAFRVIHWDNLPIYLRHQGMHAANHMPQDGLVWRATHNTTVQSRRATQMVPVAPGGTMLDYVPFHLGARNLFLYNLKTGRVHTYTEGQEPLITLVVEIDRLTAAGRPMVFYDGHAMDALSECMNDPDTLPQFGDWAAIDGNQFSNADPHRKRRKQAEMLVHEWVPWSCVIGIGVCNQDSKNRVGQILARYPDSLHRPVVVKTDWYF